jgi:hypothetical protein
MDLHTPEPVLVLSNAGTGGLNVPMFIALRRFTLVTTMLLERLMYKRKHDRSTYGAVGTMIMGEILLSKLKYVVVSKMVMFPLI